LAGFRFAGRLRFFIFANRFLRAAAAAPYNFFRAIVFFPCLGLVVAGLRAAGFFLEGRLTFREPIETRLMVPRTGVRFLTVRRRDEAGFTYKIGNVLPFGSWIKTECACQLHRSGFEYGVLLSYMTGENTSSAM
jgi:hypothetical protein